MRRQATNSRFWVPRHGTAVDQAAPITVAILRRMLEVAPRGLAGTRDRALLLIGFAGALRRSEIAALEAEALEQVHEGLVLTVTRSKTDQEGAGRQVGIPYGSNRRHVPCVHSTPGCKRPASPRARSSCPSIYDGVASLTAADLFGGEQADGGVLLHGVELLEDGEVAGRTGGSGWRMSQLASSCSPCSAISVSDNGVGADALVLGRAVGIGLDAEPSELTTSVRMASIVIPTSAPSS